VKVPTTRWRLCPTTLKVENLVKLYVETEILLGVQGREVRRLDGVSFAIEAGYDG